MGAAMVCVSLLIVNWQQRIDDRCQEGRLAVANAEKSPLLAGPDSKTAGAGASIQADG